ncbi:uncharacterized protein LOC129908403 [Episyrphus balteatus]|uniref:uncharacterized protein LOC129908403 n=1 Tax=Episyrphus balteatus TaxID=286459 RepID=UPI0024857287|nr:uncharacterized protein LOC129908403 [Episyrphus balteatus]
MSNEFPPMRDGIQDVETGEVEYIFAERDPPAQRQSIEVDAETGEPECSKITVRYLKRKSFQIPKQYLKTPPEDEDFDGPSCSKKIAAYNPFDKEAFIRMECVNKDIVLGFTKSSYLLFLVPSVFCFTKMTAVFILVCESVLHYLAHYKNRNNSNSNIFYRSPLHLLTSQFCRECCAENEMDSIRKLHKISTSRLNISLKDMTKVIG